GTGLGGLIDGGKQDVFGFASGAGVLAGSQIVESGGTASDTTVANGGLVEVLSGGLIRGAMLGGGGGLGGVIEVTSGGSAAGPITFSGFGNTLKLDGPDAAAISGATVSGFVVGDKIDLTGVPFAGGGTAQVTSGNVLHIVENGHTFDIHLDPAANFSGATWRLDTGIGTRVSIDAPPTLAAVATSASFTPGQTVTLSPSSTVTDPE